MRILPFDCSCSPALPCSISIFRAKKHSWELPIFVVNFTLTRNRARRWLSLFALCSRFGTFHANRLFCSFVWIGFYLLIVSLWKHAFCQTPNELAWNFTECDHSFCNQKLLIKAKLWRYAHCTSSLSLSRSRTAIVQVSRSMITNSIIFI